MPSIEWDSALETGDPVVDGQHQGLVELFNRLLEAEISGDTGAVPEVLVRLSDYVATHFASEEAMMRQCGYPLEASAAHMEEHRSLSERARSLVIDYREGRMGPMEELVEFLCDWLAEHVEKSDRRLVDYVRDCA